MEVSLIGAGGHARTLISSLNLSGIKVNAVYDENFKPKMKGEFISGVPLEGNLEQIPKEEKLVIAKGNVHDLKRYSEELKGRLYKKNIIHPSAIIDSKSLGDCNQFSALSFMADSAQMGSFNIIYSNSMIEHEVIIGNHNLITVNVSICGRVKIGDQCYLGASSTILPNLSICDQVIIGAGAVVIEDISEPGTYVGVPAKKLLK